MGQRFLRLCPYSFTLIPTHLSGITPKDTSLSLLLSIDEHPNTALPHIGVTVFTLIHQSRNQ
jgi:hypothetical protein